MTQKAALPTKMSDKVGNIGHVGDIAAALARNAQLAPGALHLLDQRDPAAVLGGDSGGHKSSRPAADNDDVWFYHFDMFSIDKLCFADVIVTPFTRHRPVLIGIYFLTERLKC